jgi:hypothetical protein
MRVWKWAALALMIGCGPKEDPCPEGALNASDGPCACGEGTFDPEAKYVDGDCECFEDLSLDCSASRDGDTDDTDT